MEDIRKAVSIVIVYGKEIFTITRQNYLKAFPGYTAFPGGKVDKSDETNDLEGTLLNTLKRETSEELGIEIDDLKDQGLIKNIDKIAIATSPDFNPKRYEVHFYRINLAKKVEFKIDENEVAKSDWLDSSSLLQEYNFGKRLLIFPIKRIIEALGQNPQFSEIINFDYMDRGKIPNIEPLRNFIQYMPLSNTLPPADRTNAFVIGDQIKVLIDPSPKDMNEYRPFMNEMKKYKIDKIIITHHHGDHHQFSSDLANFLAVPIYISEDSYNRCLKKFGEDYFKDNQIEFLNDGDVIGTWLNKDLKVMAVPGHDEGQFAIYPVTKEWCIVGDLFQGVGTVVVGGAEGDMTKYMNSLRRVIELDPKCVIPSHGIALGGTDIIQKTLKHREMREEQILELMQKDKTNEEILKTIYFDLPRKLHPYAMANIESHITKLKSEKKI